MSLCWSALGSFSENIMCALLFEWILWKFSSYMLCRSSCPFIVTFKLILHKVCKSFRLVQKQGKSRTVSISGV